MEICPLEVNEEDRGAGGLVIPFDRPVQVAVCSIPGPALGFRQAIAWLAVVAMLQVSTNPALDPVAAESLWPCGSAK